MRRETNSIHGSVGLIIAIVANTWTGRIVPPFLWGVIWCVRGWISSRNRKPNPPGAWQVYAAQYLKATGASLFVALLFGSLKALFRFAILR